MLFSQGRTPELAMFAVACRRVILQAGDAFLSGARLAGCRSDNAKNLVDCLAGPLRVAVHERDPVVQRGTMVVGGDNGKPGRISRGCSLVSNGPPRPCQGVRLGLGEPVLGAVRNFESAPPLVENVQSLLDACALSAAGP